MNRVRVLLLGSMVLLLAAIPLLGACTQEVVKEVPVEKTVVQTKTVPVEKTTVVEKTIKALPSIFAMSGPQGSTPGPQIIAIADQLSKDLGVKIAVENHSSYIDLFLAGKTGRSLVIAGGTTSVLDPFLGKGDYAQPDWGPQPLRTLVVGQPRFWGLWTTTKTGIKTMEDVKGKRVDYFPGSSTRNTTIENVFKAHGFTWDDVKKVNYAAAEEAQQGLLDGVVDVVLSGLPTPKLVEVDAIVGAYVIPFSGTPQMRSIWKENMPHELAVATKGDIPGVTTEIVLPASVDHYAAEDFLDEQWAYALTKAIYNAIPALHSNPATAALSQEFAARIPSSLPFHPGAIRFYKEIGLWTAEHDKFQQTKLQEEEAAKAAWRASLAK